MIDSNSSEHGFDVRGQWVRGSEVPAHTQAPFNPPRGSAHPRRNEPAEAVQLPAANGRGANDGEVGLAPRDKRPLLRGSRPCGRKRRPVRNDRHGVKRREQWIPEVSYDMDRVAVAVSVRLTEFLNERRHCVRDGIRPNDGISDVHNQIRVRPRTEGRVQ